MPRSVRGWSWRWGPTDACNEVGLPRRLRVHGRVWGSCEASPLNRSRRSAVTPRRATTPSSLDVGRSPSSSNVAGSAARLSHAFARLTTLKTPSMLGSTARGVFEEAHGHPRDSADAYAAALDAARTSREPEVAVVRLVRRSPPREPAARRVQPLRLEARAARRHRQEPRQHRVARRGGAG